MPAIILLTPRLRRRDMWIVLAALLAMAGIITNRWNVTLSGLIAPMDWSPGAAELFAVQKYVPSAVEWGVSLGVVGYALMMFTLGLRFLPMFEHNGHDGHHGRDEHHDNAHAEHAPADTEHDTPHDHEQP
ncbi:MAG: hypothetical protein GYB65_23405 [Chloroflexi bacterium]|nr:hypothetical protein [Chloroflexota bacterium]